ncbi:MAG: NDP-sugar synthase [Candidatus Aegiribacteria sp.]|nr:NDP-sugar synthase [Candidatus Aegiribacteria sp.]
MEIEGVFFLTAGYGRRDEPLSLIHPKALLPYGETSILGRLARQIRVLCPGIVRINASRCPEALLREISEVWQEEMCELYFEERPMGVSATLARHTDTISSGTWMIVNTDMIIEDFDAIGMLEYHRKTESDWTALTGSFPRDGIYSPLFTDEYMKFGQGGTERTHYWGISLMEPSIPAIAARIQASEGLFSEIASEASVNGKRLITCRQDGRWLDMGRIDILRRNILSGGSYVHPTACVSSDAVLEGSWNIGKSCILGSGAVLRNSVMLEGSSLESGTLEECILPWFCSSTDGGFV